MRRVNVYVDQPSCLELHVRETVRLDRLTLTADGYVAAQHGALLTPGVTQVAMEPGLYHLRTLDDAELRVLAGGVQVIGLRATGDKDGGPIDPPKITAGPAAASVWAAVAALGHGPCGRVPALRVVDATADAL
jgi:hypothetical protein